MINKALQKWRNKERSVGVWSNLPDLHMAEVLARTGVDWICFDLQHGLMEYRDLTYLLPALSNLPITPLVRVAANQPDQIGKVLDVGARGVIVPMVNNAKDARLAVAACRYPPAGSRSCGPMREIMLEGFEYLQQANEQIACIPMIETEEGIANVEEIAAVEGVDALFVGPMDLCYGLGIPPGDFSNERFTDAIDRILSVAAENNLATGVFGVSPEFAANCLDKGFDFASASTDISFIRAGATQAIAVASGKEQSSDTGGSPSGGY